MASNSWDAFKAESVLEEPNQLYSGGPTLSFKTIPCGVVFDVVNARMVNTSFGKRIVVSIRSHKGLEERWAFPRLAKLFVNEHGYMLPEEKWPKQIGFESVDPYIFHHTRR